MGRAPTTVKLTPAGESDARAEAVSSDLARQIAGQLGRAGPQRAADPALVPGELIFEIDLGGRSYLVTCRPRVSLPAAAGLSPREKEIVRLVARGLPNKAIAQVLDISLWTVATHVRRVFAKLGVGSRAEMIAKIMQEGLLDTAS